jgi:hypothetical protein
MKDITCNEAGKLTMKKTVVFKTSATKQGVKWVHGLLPLNGGSFRAVNIWSALATQSDGINSFRQFHVSVWKDVVLLSLHCIFVYLNIPFSQFFWGSFV